MCQIAFSLLSTINNQLAYSIVDWAMNSQSANLTTTPSYTDSVLNIKLILEVPRGIRDMMEDLVSKEKNLKLSSCFHWKPV